MHYVTLGGRLYRPQNSFGEDCRTETGSLWGHAQHGGAVTQSQIFDQARAFGAEMGLSNYRNRFYDPATGRFTQEDPIGFNGGINLYGYAGNNPASFTDPFGLCPPEDDNDGPECEQGNIVTVSLTFSVAVGDGFNIEVGTATNVDNGWAIKYARMGKSGGGGIGTGLEVTYQRGTLDEFSKSLSPDGTRTAGEFEAGKGLWSANVPLDLSGSVWQPTGGGFSVGPGFFFGFNDVQAATISKPYRPNVERCVSMAVGLGPACR
jgi:RHS repeat-associated protein